MEAVASIAMLLSKQHAALAKLWWNIVYTCGRMLPPTTSHTHTHNTNDMVVVCDTDAHTRRWRPSADHKCCAIESSPWSAFTRGFLLSGVFCWCVSPSSCMWSACVFMCVQTCGRTFAFVCDAFSYAFRIANTNTHTHTTMNKCWHEYFPFLAR